MKALKSKTDRHLLSSAAAAKKLCISQRKIQNMAARHEIPCYRFGGRNRILRFSTTDLEAFMDAHRVEATGA